MVIIEHRFATSPNAQNRASVPTPPPRDSVPIPPNPTPAQEQCSDPVANQTEGSSEHRDSPPTEDPSKCEDSPHPPSTEDNSVPQEGIEEELYVPYALIAGEDDDYSYSDSYSESE